MSTEIKYWRVTFFKDGRINNVKPIAAPGHRRWIVVEAPDEEAAKEKAYRFYCARKKREKRLRMYEQGNCICGRKQDRKYEDGRVKKECSVCAERAKPAKADWHKRKEESIRQGVPFVPKVRDEAARVEKCSERVRDRKAEMRFEVLLEVRKAWESASTNGHFTSWLKHEIAKLNDGHEPSISAVHG